MNITLRTIIIISVITLSSCKRIFYADNGEIIKKEFLNKIVADYKLDDTIRLYIPMIHIKVCGNDDRYNGKQTKYPQYIEDFYPSEKIHTIKKKTIVVSEIEINKEETFKKKYPQSLKISYEIKDDNITYIINNNKYASFEIQWKSK